MLIAIGMLLSAGASADPNQGVGIYDLVPCVTGPPNGQCPLMNDSYVRAPDPGVLGFDVLQPITGELYIQVAGTNAQILGSYVDIVFTVTVASLGSVVTDIQSRIEDATGTVVGDNIEWSGTQQFISNGTIDCQLFIGATPVCTNLTDYVQGVNVFVEGRNVTKNGPGPADPTPITLPDFPFTPDGSTLLHTGEFNINKPVERNLFLALEATYLPEPSAAQMLAPALLMLVALDRRRARAAALTRSRKIGVVSCGPWERAAT
jgi:hypothetical protein